MFLKYPIAQTANHSQLKYASYLHIPASNGIAGIMLQRFKPIYYYGIYTPNL